jgi:basic membrane protein A
VERALRDYASQGYDLVLAESFNYGDAVIKVARDFPHVKFATATHFKTAPNAAVYDWPAHHGGYLAGVLAASMTRTGKVGFVGGYEVPDVIRIAEAYKLGAKAVKPDIQVKVLYTGSWEDALKGKECAEAVLDWGADVIAQGADGPGVAALKAAAARGAFGIGYVVDQNPIAPERVLTSIVLNKTVAYQKLIADVREGKFEGKPYLFDMLAGGIVMAPYRNVPGKVRELLEETRQKILRGQIEVPNVVQSKPE